MSEIVHRRHYDVSLRLDTLFRFSNFAKTQEKLLNVIHTLTENVIEKKSADFEEKLAKNQEVKEVQNDKPVKNSSNVDNAKNAKSSAVNAMHYVRDDLDENDENDIGEKRRHAFLEMLLEMKKMGQMTDKEIWEEVNTIMFEV